MYTYKIDESNVDFSKDSKIVKTYIETILKNRGNWKEYTNKDTVLDFDSLMMISNIIFSLKSCDNLLFQNTPLGVFRYFWKRLLYMIEICLFRNL